MQEEVYFFFLTFDMNSQKMKLPTMMFLAVVLAAKMLFPVAGAAQPKPDCLRSCGNVSIPFPFGTSPDCFLDDSFLVTCNDTVSPPKPQLVGPIDVLNISLDGNLKIASYMAYDCYNDSGLHFRDVSSRLTVVNFSISAVQNKFTTVGCDTYTFVQGSKDKNYTTGCTALCNRLDDVKNGSCNGIGCCEITIPDGLRDYQLKVNSYWNHTKVQKFNPCGYAFVAERGYYNFSSADLWGLQFKATENIFPVVLEWSVGNQTCEEAKKNKLTYSCRSENSECHNSSTRKGYHCNCKQGFEGNAYLIDGCQDINECETSHPCDRICENLPGSFVCSCPKGYEGDGRKRVGCRRKILSKGTILIYVALGVISGCLLLLFGSSCLYCIFKGRKHSRLREQFFHQNGGILLQQKLSGQNNSLQRDIIFTEEELRNATDNFDEKNVIGRGGYGTVYKGVLPDNSVVAIKKSKVSDQSQIEQFINEVIILSQINHRNVVKLLGCCLETEVPLLVYEFIKNGTLYNHIHDDHLSSLFTWDLRLKIAAETAEALAYLHSATSVPIIHRDVKTVNILLDNAYTTKVSDFGASRFIPTDKTQLTTLVQGTLGYLDPEYFHSSQLTEKSDVYSFGVVLAELLTGQKALSFDRLDNGRNLSMYFVSLLEQNKVHQILDKKLLEDQRNIQQLKEVALLAKRCMNVKSEERPTMKEVAMELEGLKLMQKHPWIEKDLYPEETQLLLDSNVFSISDQDSFAASGSGFTITKAMNDSIRDKILEPLNDGR